MKLEWVKVFLTKFSPVKMHPQTGDVLLTVSRLCRQQILFVQSYENCNNFQEIS